MSILNWRNQDTWSYRPFDVAERTTQRARLTQDIDGFIPVSAEEKIKSKEREIPEGTQDAFVDDRFGFLMRRVELGKW